MLCAKYQETGLCGTWEKCDRNYFVTPTPVSDPYMLPLRNAGDTINSHSFFCLSSKGSNSWNIKCEISFLLSSCCKNMFEDTKGVFRSCKSKIPKGYSEAVNLRTDNTGAKSKRTNNGLQNITLKTKDWALQTPLKTGGELRCSVKTSSSCSTCGTSRITLVTNQLISHERGKDQIVITTNRTYPWSFVTQILCNL